MQQLHTRLLTGARVAARGDLWSILRSERFEAGTFVTLEGRGRDNRGRRTTLISPFDAIEPQAVRAPRWLRRRAALRFTLSAIARERPPGSVWTALDGKFDVFPWQLAPTLAVLSGATRLLLADAVGLGKTLQAGLVAAELAARGLIAHTLILTPPALREAWASELGDRLGLDVAVLDPFTLDSCRHERRAGANPWTITPVVVSSIDFVKRSEVRAAVEAAPIDLLIVDEAHHLTSGSDRAAVVSRLAGRVPWFLLVSATPHSGDSAAFRFLLDLGSTGEAHEPPMVVFRRSAADAGRTARRSSTLLAVTPTAEERALIDGLLAYARAICRGPFGTRPGVRLVAGLLARRAISSAWAAERSLCRRLEVLSGDLPSMDAAQTTLPWDELETVDGTEDAWLGAPGLPRSSDECDWLRQLTALARAARAHASKFQRLRRLLRLTTEPTVVFTEFRDTLEACRDAIGADRLVVCLHGGLDVPERRRVLGAFLHGRADVLLATDVAGEGLNLQARARLVVTLEWPWNPQRLEQRIGRVDRIGQTRTVHAVLLTARGTVEETVVARLLARSARSRVDLDRLASTNPGAAVEAAVLEGVLGAEPPPRSWPQTVPDAHAALEATRIVDRRRLAAASRGSARVSSCWTVPVRGMRTARVVVLIEVNAARAGRLAWSRLVLVKLDLLTPPEDRGEWKRVCRALARARAVHDAAMDATRLGAGDQSWHPVVARILAIRRALAKGPTPLVQASLFDRRAIRDARARAAVLEALDAHLARTASVLAISDAALDLDTRVVAVVPLARDGAGRRIRP